MKRQSSTAQLCAFFFFIITPCAYAGLMTDDAPGFTPQGPAAPGGFTPGGFTPSPTAPPSFSPTGQTKPPQPSAGQQQAEKMAVSCPWSNIPLSVQDVKEIRQAHYLGNNVTNATISPQGTVTYQQVPQTHRNKSGIPTNVKQWAAQTRSSNSRWMMSQGMHHPSGAALFSDGALATAFNSFLQALEHDLVTHSYRMEQVIPAGLDPYKELGITQANMTPAHYDEYTQSVWIIINAHLGIDSAHIPTSDELKDAVKPASILVSINLLTNPSDNDLNNALRNPRYVAAINNLIAELENPNPVQQQAIEIIQAINAGKRTYKKSTMHVVADLIGLPPTYPPSESISVSQAPTTQEPLATTATQFLTVIRAQVKRALQAKKITAQQEAAIETLIEPTYKPVKIASTTDKQLKSFILYFSTLQKAALHELYLYLIDIYANLNLWRVILDRSNPTQSLVDFYTTEQTYGLNIKTLIINHLINLIEAQLNNAILTMFPTLPKHLATHVGKEVVIRHDYGADLSLLLNEEEISTLAPQDTQQVKGLQQEYLAIFGKYLAFMEAHTQKITESDPANGYLGFTTFATNAQKIAQALESYQPTTKAQQLQKTMHQQRAARSSDNTKADPALSKTIQALSELKRINPPLFFYDVATMRSLKLIPQLANDLPPGTQRIGWPEQIKQKAASGELAGTALGKAYSYKLAAYSSDGKQLLVNIPIINASIKQPSIHVQRLAQQPAWLSLWEGKGKEKGIVDVLRACLGDYSAVIGMGVFDPCLESIIVASRNNSAPRSPECQRFIQCAQQAERLLKPSAITRTQ